MKKFLLLFVAVSVSIPLFAQRRHISRHQYAGKPTVYVISVTESDTLWSNNPALAEHQMMMQKNKAAQSAIADHRKALRPGVQQVGEPSVIFANTKNSFSFAIGGYVNLRLGYGFDSTIDNIDVVPFDIPIPSNYASKQRLMMDASTSRVYFRGIARSKKLGPVEIFFDVDFRTYGRSRCLDFL